MKKFTILLAATLCLSSVAAVGQRYMTRTGKITFFSSTPMENIEAINNETACAIDARTGDVMFQAPIKSFRFERALMQEHFNENYMESDKFPKADFKGRVTNISSVNFSKPGNYDVKVEGKLTIHGVARQVTIPGTVIVQGSGITATSKFRVRPGDYGIKIPGVVSGKIAQDIEVTVNSIMAQK